MPFVCIAPHSNNVQTSVSFYNFTAVSYIEKKLIIKWRKK